MQPALPTHDRPAGGKVASNLRETAGRLGRMDLIRRVVAEAERPVQRQSTSHLAIRAVIGRLLDVLGEEHGGGGPWGMSTTAAARAINAAGGRTRW
jgi:hypothetical protein